MGKILQGVQEAIEDVKSKTGDSDEIQNAFAVKTEEIKIAREESDRVFQMAIEAERKVQESELALDKIKKLVEEIKSIKLPEIVTDIGTLVEEEGYEQKSLTIQDQLDALRKKFEVVKKEQEEQISSIKNRLDEDGKNLESLEAKKSNLEAEVENLERIRDLLPKWCSGDSTDSNENP